MSNLTKFLLVIFSLFLISCEHSNIISRKHGNVFIRNSSYKQNSNQRSQRIRLLERKISSIYKTEKYAHTIFFMDLLSLGSSNKNILKKQPYIGEPYHVMRSQKMSSVKKQRYFNLYSSRLNKLKGQKRKVNKLLNSNSDKKIKEIYLFVKKLNRRLTAYNVRSSNPLRISVNKLDRYLSSKRKNINNMSLSQKLSVLRNSLIVLENIPVALPLDNYRVTSRFRVRWHPIKKKRTMHTGIDVVGKKYSYVLSTSNGRVTFAGRQRGYGKTIIISHAKGSSTLYGHLYDIYVKKGEQVKIGQIIGVQGSTGGSTSDHLHYEVRLKNQKLNPEIFQRF